MFDNKIIGLFVILCMFVGITSCKRKIEYRYKDVIVTRYDYTHLSEYYCNQTDTKYKIKLSGVQNFYKAWLCINKETKKTWILQYDCLIQQQFVDYANFQAELYNYPDSIDYEYIQELKNINELIMEDSKLLEEKYAIYILCGLGDAYINTEIEWNREMFPNSEIHPIY